MNAFDDEEEEKPQKLRGTVPKYPATGPLDAGSADDWMTWAGDFRTYAGWRKQCPCDIPCPLQLLFRCLVPVWMGMKELQSARLFRALEPFTLGANCLH